MTTTAVAETSWRRRLATLLRRAPWSGRVVQTLVRVIQPRFSAGVVGVLLDASGQRVLLVEHVFHVAQPWGLPGGWINRGEEPEHALAREFLEETALRVRAVRPLIVRLGYKWPRHFDMVYLCALDGDPAPIRLSNELLDYRWTPLTDLPDLSALYRDGIQAALKDRAE